VLKNDALDADDRARSLQLIETMLLHGEGKMDDHIPGLIELINEEFPKIDLEGVTLLFKVSVVEVVCNVIVYNTPVALSLLEQRGLTSQFFNAWFSNIDQFTRVHDIQLCLVTIASLLSLPPSQLPPTVQAGYADLLPKALHLFEELPAAVANRNLLKKMNGLMDGDEEEEEDETPSQTGEDESQLDAASSDYSDVSDDDDIQDSDDEYLAHLAEKASKGLHKNDDAGEVEELEEDLYMETPLDKVDLKGRYAAILHGECISCHGVLAIRLKALL
ncbi:hypothetical protein HDU93_004291, partial [Gonapodya sp. JEL0774]